MSIYPDLMNNAMTRDVNQILVFKTNISTECDKQRILTLLNAHSEIKQCNIDLHDVDFVLRIVTDTLTEEEIISIINTSGFECAGLE